MKLLRKLRALFRKEKLDAEMAEEMRTHLDLQTEQNMQRGLSPQEARFAAHRAFGGVEQIKERARDRRGFRWLEQGLQDLRFAARALRKSPGFAIVAVLTLAIGIGANTSLFTAIDTIMLRPLAVPEPSRLVYLATGRNELFSFPFYERMREAAGSFAGFSAIQYRAAPRELTFGGGEVESVRTQAATGNVFSALGVPALIGRTLAPDDDRSGAAQPVVVISHAFWQRRFGLDPAVVGRSVQLENVPVTIVGVMPADFAGFEIGSNPELWFPLQLVPQFGGRERDRLAEGVDWLVLFGRLRDGITREQAQAEVSGIFRRQLENEAAINPNRPPAERERILSRTLELHAGAAGYVVARSQFKQPLVVLMAAMGVVLLIACSNVAGLLLARGAARQREFALRAALGAGRARIVRQLLTESLLLALVGGALGFVFAHWGTRFLAAFLEQSNAALPLDPDGRVLLFTLAASLLTGALFGLAPALRLSRIDLATAIQQQSAAATGGARPRLQSMLVVMQVALSVLLLAGAGLFVRTLHNLRTLHLGFVPENLLTLSIDPGRWRPAAAERNALLRRLLEELETLPGVRSVSIGGAGLLSGNGYNTHFTVDGYTPAPDEELRASVIFAGPRFFETLRVPLLRGREFTLADEPAPTPGGGPASVAQVAILGEAMARKYFGDADPIGRHITRRLPSNARLEIVGVAKDTKYSRNLRDQTPLEFYLPYFGSGVGMPPTFYLRAERSAAALGPDIQRLIARIEPRLTLRDLHSMDAAIDRLLVRERIIAQIVGFFSVFALLLASLGVYGLLSYSVAQRTREIGVRMALGATLRDVMALVLRQGVTLALLGCALGIGAALAVTRFVAALLYGVTPTDPLTLIAVAGLLLIIAAMACWLPARRAAKVNPMTALRAE